MWHIILTIRYNGSAHKTISIMTSNPLPQERYQYALETVCRGYVSPRDAAVVFYHSERQ